MAKQYKNVYTILEKVKKGEIKSYYKDDDQGLFGKINFYKKPDLIKPHMHWLDEDRIDKIMDYHMYYGDYKQAKDSYNKFAKSADYQKKIPDGQKPDFNAFVEKLRENYRNFPKHLVKDIFKMYYNPMEKLEFEERTEKNHTKFRFLENANNPVAKIMSQGSNLKSAIFARNILTNYLLRMTQMDYVDAEQSEKIKNGLNGNSDFDNEGVDKAMDSMCNSAASKKAMEEAIKEATEMCKSMDESLSDDIQEKMFENANKGGSDGTAGTLTPDYIRIVSSKLEEIKLSMGCLKEKLKKLLDKSVSYFSAKKETVYEDLFNSDNMAGLDEFELLHPKLRKIFAEDLQVKDTRSVGKIDVYIDVSGSMSSTCGVRDVKGNDVSRIDFAKSMVAKLAQLDMLNDVYVFDTRVRKYKKDPVSIAMLDCNGGTTINNAIRNIEKNGVNAIIITDAEDGCDTYCDKAFFIGLNGARFNHFNDDVISEYSRKDQVVIFNGSTINKVDKKGYMIK